MAAQARRVREFVDEVHISKFENFPTGNNITLAEKPKLAMRLDHQGMNTDDTHRIYIQPLGGGGKTKGTGKSRNISRMGNGNVVARAHVADGVPPEEVRDALVLSARNDRQIVLLKVGAAAEIVPDKK